MRLVITIAVCGLAAALAPSTAFTMDPEAASVFDSGVPPVPSHLRVPPRVLPGGGPPPLHNQGLIRVAYSDASTGVFLGSPAITRLDSDTLLIAHDFFPEWSRPKRTAVMASKDGGASWERRAVVEHQFWSSIFLHRGALYLLGTDEAAEQNAVSIARSTDGGFSWNRTAVLHPPEGCQFGTGAVPVLLEGGRLWRGMEYWCGPTLRWPQSYHALLIHVAEEADLMDAAAWQATYPGQIGMSMIPAWMPPPVLSAGVLEGNAVKLPFGGGVGLLLRCRVYDGQGKMYGVQQACLFKLKPEPASATAPDQHLPDQQAANQQASAVPGYLQGDEEEQPERDRQLVEQVVAGSQASLRQPWLSGTSVGQLASVGAEQPKQQHQQEGSATLAASATDSSLSGPKPQRTDAHAAPVPPRQLTWHGFIDMPGGGNKFQVRYDAVSRQYLALTNPSIDRYGSNPDARNIMVLVHSPNLLDWRIATTVLVPNDGLTWEKSIWYTGYHYADWVIDGDDMLAAIRTAYDGANSFHNSNQITFKRIERFRQYLPSSSQPFR